MIVLTSDHHLVTEGQQTFASAPFAPSFLHMLPSPLTFFDAPKTIGNILRLSYSTLYTAVYTPIPYYTIKTS